jgi:predicted MFS family arabinose efflux permease
VFVCFLGVSVGSLLGGVLIDNYLGATTFLIYGIFSLVLCFVHIVVQLVIGGNTQHSEQTKGKN